MKIFNELAKKVSDYHESSPKKDMQKSSMETSEKHENMESDDKMQAMHEELEDALAPELHAKVKEIMAKYGMHKEEKSSLK